MTRIWQIVGGVSALTAVVFPIGAWFSNRVSNVEADTADNRASVVRVQADVDGLKPQLADINSKLTLIIGKLIK